MALRHVAERGGLALSESWVDCARDHAAWEAPLTANSTAAGATHRYTVHAAGRNSQGGTALMILDARVPCGPHAVV